MEVILVFLIFFATSGLVLFNLKKGIELYILLFPFLQPYVVLDLAFFRYPLQAILTVVVFLCIVFKTVRSKKAAADIKTNFLGYPVFLLMFILLFTVIINTEVIAANTVAYIFFFLQKLAVAYIGWMAFNTVEKGEKLFAKVLKIFALLCVYGIIESLLKTSPIIDIFNRGGSSAIASDLILKYTFDDDRGYRIQTVFYHSYSWGGYLVILGSSFLFLVFNAKSNYSFYKYGLMFVIVFFNIFLTRSRSCFVPTVFMIGTMFWIMPGGKRKSTLITVIIFAAVCAMTLSPKLLNSFEGYFTAKDDGQVKGSSAQMRAVQFGTAFSMVKDNYIAGSGFGAIKKVLADLGGDSDLKGAESIWLVILIDNGIIGIIAYIVFFTSVIRRFLKEKRRAITKATERKISIAIVTVICYIIFVTLTGEMNTFAFFMLYAGMFGKLIYLQIQREKEAAFYNQQQAINNQSITGNIAA
ncbi:MAG: hypothetical protein JWQ57_1865 [Mucilaginibacter sp.]|nr:hypothetical protein [Mucilaginibacter sp.]